MSFYRWSSGSENNEGWTAAKIKALAKKVLLGVVIGVIAIGALTCFYTVDDKQQAVVTTFGKVTDVTGAGLHFKAPFGHLSRPFLTKSAPVPGKG